MGINIRMVLPLMYNENYHDVHVLQYFSLGLTE